MSSRQLEGGFGTQENRGGETDLDATDIIVEMVQDSETTPTEGVDKFKEETEVYQGSGQ